VDERDVRAALARVGLEPNAVTAIEGGWANWTFDLDSELIVRFPRNDSVAMATHRELSLLPELAPALSFAIPVPSHVGAWHDRPFFAYPRLAGDAYGERARPAAGFAAALGGMLAELQAFPVERAAHLLRLGRPETVWLARYEDLWPTVRDVALPEMGRDLAEEVTRRYHRLIDDPPAFPPCLVHNDLGPEHVLVGDDGMPTGLIDFEDASVGDPAVDLTWWVAMLGEDTRPDLVGRRDWGERLEERLGFYRWMGSVHAVIYGVTEGTEERVGGVEETRRRLAATRASVEGSA
jgi:aminoglycoside 2''-phosphotransferase